MPVEAIGYLTNDGAFYESEAEARRHEHLLVIHQACESHKVDPNRFLTLLHFMIVAVRGYIDANEECINQAKENPVAPYRDQADNELRNVVDETLEQQPTSGHNDVSDMGDSSRFEGVPERLKKHGPRMR